MLVIAIGGRLVAEIGDMVYDFDDLLFVEMFEAVYIEDGGWRDLEMFVHVCDDLEFMADVGEGQSVV